MFVNGGGSKVSSVTSKALHDLALALFLTYIFHIPQALVNFKHFQFPMDTRFPFTAEHMSLLFQGCHFLFCTFQVLSFLILNFFL